MNQAPRRARRTLVRYATTQGESQGSSLCRSSFDVIPGWAGTAVVIYLIVYLIITTYMAATEQQEMLAHPHLTVRDKSGRQVVLYEPPSAPLQGPITLGARSNHLRVTIPDQNVTKDHPKTVFVNQHEHNGAKLLGGGEYLLQFVESDRKDSAKGPTWKLVIQK